MKSQIFRNIKGYKYDKEDKYFVVNDGDSQCKPIYISLPKAPPLKYIDGYGDDPIDQKWKRLELPKRLQLLEQRVYKVLDEWAKERQVNTITGYKIIKKFWELLNAEQYNYQEEIEYIKKVQWYLTHGYWRFIKGKPTYFPPQYFQFLNFWYMPHLTSQEKYPEFREEDRLTELFKYYLMTTKETFKHLDSKGVAQKNSDGKYEMIEMENRTFYGVLIPKRRRCGETNRALNNGYWIVSRGVSRSGSIMADKAEHSEEHWTKRMIPAWRGFPMFLKPVWDGNNSPVKLHLTTPSNVYNEKSLGSILKYLGSAGERAADSDKLNYILADESGKLTKVDSSERWGVTKLTLAQGPNIHGWAELPSTVEEMNEGGEEYYDMWMNSDFYLRNKVNGQTTTGLGRKFAGAHRAYDGYIDAWGFSVIDKPTQSQIDHAPKNAAYKSGGIGAMEYHQMRRAQLLAAKDPRYKKEYRGLRRREPLDSSECWMGTSGDIGFPLEEIDSQLAILRINNYKDIVTGNFVRRDGKQDGIVDFVETPNGKFNLSLLLDKDGGYKSNEQTLMRKWSTKFNTYIDAFSPKYKSRFTMGIDPMTNLSRDPKDIIKSRLSDGGIAVYWEVDKQLEPNWNTSTGESGRIVCTYRYRADNFHEFVEDVIMCAQYFQAMMFFERNKNEIINRIEDRGYSGYFKYAYNIKTEQFETQPGGYAGGDSIDSLFTSLRDHLDLRVHKEVHADWLQEAKQITGKEKLNRNDLLAAVGWALEGSKSTYGQIIDNIEHRRNTGNRANLYSGFLKPRSY